MVAWLLLQILKIFRLEYRLGNSRVDPSNSITNLHLDIYISPRYLQSSTACSGGKMAFFKIYTRLTII